MPPKSQGLSSKTKDLMEVPPVTVTEDTTIEEAAAIMWEKNIGSVIVVDFSGVMSGILTERDIIFAVAKSLTGKRIPVSSVMSKTSLMAHPNESIITSLDRMMKAGVKHLPVVDKEGQPLGMISMRDALSISEPILKFVLHRTKSKRSSKG